MAARRAAPGTDRPAVAAAAPTLRPQDQDITGQVGDGRVWPTQIRGFAEQRSFALARALR
jgi:hypothetical protein